VTVQAHEEAVGGLVSLTVFARLREGRLYFRFLPASGADVWRRAFMRVRRAGFATRVRLAVALHVAQVPTPVLLGLRAPRRRGGGRLAESPEGGSRTTDRPTDDLINADLSGSLIGTVRPVVGIADSDRKVNMAVTRYTRRTKYTETCGCPELSELGAGGHADGIHVGRRCQIVQR
jgi:hypothetical protein